MLIVYSIVCCPNTAIFSYLKTAQRYNFFFSFLFPLPRSKVNANKATVSRMRSTPKELVLDTVAVGVILLSGKEIKASYSKIVIVWGPKFTYFDSESLLEFRD